MTTIDKKNVGEYRVNGTWAVACSFKADKDSSESKTVTLNVEFDNVPVAGIIEKALSPTKIAWQNGPGRGKFDTWKDKQTVNIKFTAPGKLQVDPETAMIEKLQSMAPAEMQDYLNRLAEEVEARQAKESEITE